MVRRTSASAPRATATAAATRSASTFEQLPALVRRGGSHDGCQTRAQQQPKDRGVHRVERAGAVVLDAHDATVDHRSGPLLPMGAQEASVHAGEADRPSPPRGQAGDQAGLDGARERQDDHLEVGRGALP